MMSGKRVAQVAPFAVLFGGLTAGILALPPVGVLSPVDFNVALAGVIFFFAVRWFSRRVRQYSRALKHETAGERTDRVRAARRAKRAMRALGR